MLQIEISNFRTLRGLALTLDRPLSVIVGENESGKSTLLQALKWACTGEAYGHKGKEAPAALTTYGEDKLSVRLEMDGLAAARTQSTGTALKQVAEQLNISPELLPLLFDAEMCGDGGSKHLKAFFCAVGAEAFRPGTHFANDPVILACLDAATKAGATTTKKITQFCESMRAMSKDPGRPPIPPVAEPAEATITQQKTLVETARQIRDGRQAELVGVQNHAKGLSQISSYLNELANYQAALAQSTGQDALGERRRSLEIVANVNTSSMQQLALVFGQAGFAAAAQALQLAVTELTTALKSATETLKANPPAKAVPVPPALPPAGAALYTEGMTLAQVAQQAQALYTKEQELKAKLQVDDHYLQQQVQLLEGLQRAMGAWSTYRTQMPKFEKDLQAAREAWDRWDTAAKTIALAEAEFLAKSAATFAELISEFTADILNGRKVTIDSEANIFVGPTNILDCSKSARWRAEVAIMTAIAYTLRSPLLLIDGADILDLKNRRAMITFLVSKVAPRFKHVILTTTAARTLEEEARLPPDLLSVSKYILSNGTVSLLPTLVPTPPPVPQG